MTTNPPLKASWLLLSYDEFKSLKMNKKFNILKKKTSLSIFSFFFFPKWVIFYALAQTISAALIKRYL